MTPFELILILIFNFFNVIYFFSLTGSDHTVTGKINPEVKEEIFRAYVFWESIQNQSIALLTTLLFYLLGASTFTVILVYATVSWDWFGGGLDFVWHGIKGEMPPLDKIWFWMPFKLKTWQFAVYALITFTLLIIGWTLNFAGVIN